MLLPTPLCICRVHPQEQQQPQPAAASKAASKQQAHPPSASQAAELLYNKWLLDVPKMADLAVLYGPSNAGLTGQLLQALLALQPKYAKVRGAG